MIFSVRATLSDAAPATLLRGKVTLSFCSASQDRKVASRLAQADARRLSQHPGYASSDAVAVSPHIKPGQQCAVHSQLPSHPIANSSRKPCAPSHRITRPMLRAAVSGDHSTLREILCVAPELVYSTSKNGETAAHIAARSGTVAAVEMLLAAAPDLFYVKDRRGRTPAQVTRANHNRLVRLLMHAVHRGVRFRHFQFLLL